jgi:DNA-directed RNA polymerase specialized sigma24 family protein
LRPSEAFDRVLDTVRRYQANQHRIPAVPLKRESSGGRPQVGNWRAEYIAEFVLCGRLALRPWKERRTFFESYFVSNLTARQVQELMGIEERTVKFWAQEVKKTVGIELMRRGLHKPMRYPEPSGRKNTDLTEEIY